VHSGETIGPVPSVRNVTIVTPTTDEQLPRDAVPRRRFRIYARDRVGKVEPSRGDFLGAVVSSPEGHAAVAHLRLVARVAATRRLPFGRLDARATTTGAALA
jgi:hypothetical protein